MAGAGPAQRAEDGHAPGDQPVGDAADYGQNQDREHRPPVDPPPTEPAEAAEPEPPPAKPAKPERDPERDGRPDGLGAVQVRRRGVARIELAYQRAGIDTQAAGEHTDLIAGRSVAAR